MTTLEEYKILNAVIDNMKTPKTNPPVMNKPLHDDSRICVDCGSVTTTFDSCRGAYMWYRIRDEYDNVVGHRCKKCYYRNLDHFKNPNMKHIGKYGPYASVGKKIFNTLDTKKKKNGRRLR